MVMFGVVFSIVLYHEQITTKLALGFVFISIAVIICEIKLSFFEEKRKNKY